MSFNHHHGHRPSLTAGEAMENQIPTSPMDTDFSVPTTPVDSVFSHSSSSSSSSPMDMTFPDSFPLECSTSSSYGSSNSIIPTTPASPIVSPTTTAAAAANCFGSQSTMVSSSSSPTTPTSTQPPTSQTSFSTTPPTGYSQSTKRHQKNPGFHKKLQEMALPLAPLVQLTTGQVHPSFPSTLLRFWLLTDAELEGLAHFYHQRTPSRWTFHYPCPVAWDAGLALEEKRRRIGKFIGLRGCDTPVRVRSEEEILDEARRARERDEEDEVWRRKLHWY
ncbi:hypothetical protein E8E14_003479 [Neopestalotiopsis sp. 37M]|nr:hypothetical protein E8E14_003479 [Neopestalotiopsis sp. 37M]